MIFKRGVEGDQQTREDIDEMSKIQETETEEQMNRVPTTLETVVQGSVRKVDTHNCTAEAETRPTFAVQIKISAVRVIDVESTKQDVISLSAIQFELCTLEIGGARTIHTDYMERDCIERGMMKLETMIVGAWVGEQLLVVSSAGLTIGEDLSQLDNRCCVAYYSWSGIV